MARKTVERNISYDDQRKVYYVSMDLGKNEQGRRMKRYQTYPTLHAARTGLRQFLMHREEELRTPKHGMTLGDWLESWMENIVRPTRAETTVYGYQKIIDNHLLPALGDIPLIKLTPMDIQRYYIQVQQNANLSGNTLRRHHDLLSSALRSAMRQEKILVSPMDRVEPPRARQKEASYYRPEELKQLYTLVEGHRLELCTKLAGSLGMRREEICGLKWESIDYQRQLLFVREARTAFGATVVQKETKTPSSVRTLFLSDDMAQLLRREQERQKGMYRLGQLREPSEFVVLNPKGQPYSPNALSLAFTRFVKKNGMPRLTLHGLRHPNVKPKTKTFSSFLEIFSHVAWDISLNHT